MGRKLGQKTAKWPEVDGVIWYNISQAARHLNTSQEAIRRAATNGGLCPGKVGGQLVFSRRDLERWRRIEREHAITTQLVKGAHPLDVYLEHPGRYSLNDVTRTLQEWARLSGVWLVEGPRGSYARWLARFGLTRCTPRELRRVVEALTRDPELGERVRALFTDQRRAG